MWLTFYLFSVAYGERSRLLSLLRPSFSCRPRRAEKGPGWCAQGERARGREDAGTERGAYTSRYNADTLPLPRRSCIRCRGESRAKQRRTGLSTPSLPYGVQDARPRVCIVYEREKDWSGERLRTWVVWFEGCIVSQVLKTVAVSPRRYYFSHLRAILDSFITDRSESILFFYPFDLISDLFIDGAWNEKRRSTCCGSFSLGWSRCNKVAIDTTRPEESVLWNQLIPAEFSQLVRSKIQSTAIKSTDHCKGIIGRKSLDHYQACFSPRSCRCSRASRKPCCWGGQKRVRDSNSVVPSCLATNYSGRRALLHACRCDVPSTPRPRRASRKRPWNGLTFRASRGESSSRGPVYNW